MSKLAKEVVKLHKKVGKENRIWTPYKNVYSEKTVQRNINSYFNYLNNEKIPNRERIVFGIPLMGNQRKELIGYSLIKIFSNAKPSKYEKKFGNKLNYVNLQDFFIGNKYWNKIVNLSENEEIYYPKELIEYCIDISQKLNKEFVCDILSKNKKIKNFLEKNSIFEDFKWKDSKNNLISRMVL
jgi:hypothetical protein